MNWNCPCCKERITWSYRNKFRAWYLMPKSLPCSSCGKLISPNKWAYAGVVISPIVLYKYGIPAMLGQDATTTDVNLLCIFAVLAALAEFNLKFVEVNK